MKRLYNIIRNILALVGLISIIGGSYLVISYAQSYGLPPRLLMLKALNKYGLGSSIIARFVTPPPLKPATLVLPSLDTPDWQGRGARADRKLLPVQYNSDGRPVPQALHRDKSKPVVPNENKTNIVNISNSKELLNAIRKALPGDIITLEPGIYPIKSRSINIKSGGTFMQPITVRAQKFGEVFLELNTLEGFHIKKPYWIFENLDIKGTCKYDDYCEHAFHIVGDGRGFVLRNSRIHEFNSMIKGNGIQNGKEPRICPDNVLLEGNSFYNSSARKTSHPVSFVDVVCPDHWILRDNLIADFRKAKGDQISYGVQIKGNASYAVFENNLVVCEHSVPGGVRVGLSLGGGGTGKDFFRDGNSQFEHKNGIVRNNIVMYCSDVGLYLNKARDTKVLNNTFYKTNGIDIRFPESSALVLNNLLSGKIYDRDGGTSVRRNNLVRNVKEFDKLFMNPAVGNFTLKNGKKIVDNGELVDQVWEDFCGNPRDDRPDIGAIEYGGTKSCLPLGNVK